MSIFTLRSFRPIAITSTLQHFIRKRVYKSPQLLRKAAPNNLASWNALTQKTCLKGRRKATVEQIVRETPDTLSIVFSIEDRGSFTFNAGQYITCFFPVPNQGTHPGKIELKRAYSLSSLASESLLKITVKRLLDGKASSHIHQHLKPGNQFEFLGPNGEFCLPEEAYSHYIFIAAGSGITPILPQLVTLLQSVPDASVNLLVGARSYEEIIFHKALNTLARKHSTLSIRYHLSSALKNHSPSKSTKNITYLKQRIAPENVRSLITAPSETVVMQCGPDSLMHSLNQEVFGREFPALPVYQERFLIAAKHPKALPQSPQQIVFKKSLRTIFSKPGQTILEAAFDAGITVKHSCQMGGCGHCKTRIIKGNTIEDLPNCLSPEEKAQGYSLACCTYAADTIEIDA